MTALTDLYQEVILEIYDPEVPVNIHDLGLIYSVNVANSSSVQVTMTLTSIPPGGSVGGELPAPGGLLRDLAGMLSRWGGRWFLRPFTRRPPRREDPCEPAQGPGGRRGHPSGP